MSSKFSHWSLNNAPLLIITSHIVNWNIFSCNSFAFQDQDCFYLLLCLISYVLSSNSWTGSGKTYTMQPLPLRAAQDMVCLLHQPVYRNQNFKLWLSYFEIYGGKLFDLLSDRRLVIAFFIWSCQISINI